jgi:hypothetical protein
MESPPLAANGPALFRRIVIGIACVAAVWAGFKLTEEPLLVFVAALGAFYVLTLAANYRWLAWLVIALRPAALIVPFLRGRPFFWELCALLAWPSLGAFLLLNRHRLEDLRLDRVERRALLALGGYLLVIVMLMIVRGVGFRAFGGDQMGGRFYVQQVVLVILPLLMIAAQPTKKFVLGAAVAGWAMSLTYLVSDFALSAGGPALRFLLYFFEVPTDALNFEYGFEFTGLRRYQSLAIVAGSLLALLWTLAPLHRLLLRRGLWGLPLMAGCLLVGLGSGHRTLLVVSATTLLLLMFFQRFWTPARVVAVVFAAGAVAGCLYAFAERLPLPVQRSISFLPGIDVSTLAKDDAAATINDRIEVLTLALHDVPEYWLVGRGFGMERFDLLPPDAVHAGVWQQYLNGSFYNGTIGLFLKTGLPGLLCSLFYVWWISRAAADILRTVRRRSADEQGFFDRFALLLCAQWFSTVAFFYLAHGDAGDWLQEVGLSSALILACRRLLRAEPPETENLNPADQQPAHTSGHVLPARSRG